MQEAKGIENAQKKRKRNVRIREGNEAFILLEIWFSYFTFTRTIFLFRRAIFYS